jgi:hypothetical protein
MRRTASASAGEAIGKPERKSGRLLAVAQRRVENSNLLGHVEFASVSIPLLAYRPNPGITAFPVDVTREELSKL